MALHLLIEDAALLIRQYELRNHPHDALSAAQRKAWAAETVAVLQALVAIIEPVARAREPVRSVDVSVRWGQELAAGRRPVTSKYRRPDGKPPAPPLALPDGPMSAYVRNLQAQRAEATPNGGD
jgi:hypothetical protein